MKFPNYIYKLNYTIKRLLGMIEPYNGLLNIFDSVKSINKTKKYKKSYLFYTNSSGERFWIKYLAYYAVKTYELVESIDYMWSDSPLKPLHSTKKNKMKAFYKWSSGYQNPILMDLI